MGLRGGIKSGKASWKKLLGLGLEGWCRISLEVKGKSFAERSHGVNLFIQTMYTGNYCVPGSKGKV